MTDKEYEQKRRECWEEFCNDSCFCNSYGMTEEAFYSAFDRAYALGKEKETISQDEIEKASVEYADKTAKLYEVCNSEFVQEIMVAFEQGANFALGKQEKEVDTLLWSRLTEDEKREMQCRYHTNECVLRDHKKRTGDKAQSKAVARMKLLENLFGKENLKVDNK